MTQIELPPPPRRRPVFRIAVVLIVLALVAGELVARYGLGLGDPPLSMFDADTEYRFVPGVYHRFGHTISYNAFSMRSPTVSKQKLDPAELRVIVLGDSIVNGGAQTDDRELATTLLADRLTKHFGRPVRVCNVSAGSWGPPNEAAYLKEFGWFDADALVVVVSSHDGADAPTFSPTVGVSADFPDHKPFCALWEGIARYTPLKRWMVSSAADPGVPSTDAPPPGAAPQCRAAMDEMFDRAAAAGIPAMLVMSWERPELADRRLHDVGRPLLDAATAHRVPVLDFGPVQAAALQQGKSPFRDNDHIHPNAYGQSLLCDLIAPQLERVLGTRATTRPLALSPGTPGED